MGMLKEFKDFAMKGNVVDMAVGIVIGGAFGKIVSSFVSDILMPPISLLMGNTNFADLKVVLREATEQAGEVVNPAITWNYGSFLQTVIDFLIIGFAIFMVVRAMNKMKKKEEEAPKAPAGPTQEELLTQIRDLLKK